MLLNRMRCAAFAGMGLVLTGGSASAHHLMGGKIPSTFAEGILSGVGHPIIGPDHLAFLIALGIAVGVARLSFVNPFLFLVAMACGVAAHVAAITIPAAELIVALSVLVAGLLLIAAFRPAGGWASSSLPGSSMAMLMASRFTALSRRRLPPTWRGLSQFRPY